jgi:type III pantothenate kinase
VLLTIDVGNTTTKLGFFGRNGGEVGTLLHTWRVSTVRSRSSDEYGVLFRSLFDGTALAHDEVEAIAISSVVPQIDHLLAEACVRYMQVQPFFLNACSQELIPVRTDRPKELGADLVAAAVGAVALYGAPAVVIGFGTATTFGAISADGAFLGAAIAPGIQISIDALVARTAKLPQVALHAPPEAIGRDTVSALQSGIVYGFVGQVEGLVGRIKREIGEGARVIATGGFAEVIARHTSAIDTVDPHLILEGLRRYYDSVR